MARIGWRAYRLQTNVKLSEHTLTVINLYKVYSNPTISATRKQNAPQKNRGKRFSCKVFEFQYINAYAVVSIDGHTVVVDVNHWTHATAAAALDNDNFLKPFCKKVVGHTTRGTVITNSIHFRVHLNAGLQFSGALHVTARIFNVEENTLFKSS